MIVSVKLSVGGGAPADSGACRSPWAERVAVADNLMQSRKCCRWQIVANACGSTGLADGPQCIDCSWRKGRGKAGILGITVRFRTDRGMKYDGTCTRKGTPGDARPLAVQQRARHGLSSASPGPDSQTGTGIARTGPRTLAQSRGGGGRLAYRPGQASWPAGGGPMSVGTPVLANHVRSGACTLCVYFCTRESRRSGTTRA